jgi:hypothetical protein
MEATRARPSHRTERTQLYPKGRQRWFALGSWAVPRASHRSKVGKLLDWARVDSVATNAWRKLPVC